MSIPEDPNQFSYLDYAKTRYVVRVWGGAVEGEAHSFVYLFLELLVFTAITEL